MHILERIDRGRVKLDTGEITSLPLLSQRIGLSYPGLMERIKKFGLTSPNVCETYSKPTKKVLPEFFVSSEKTPTGIVFYGDDGEDYTPATIANTCGQEYNLIYTRLQNAKLPVLVADIITARRKKTGPRQRDALPGFDRLRECSRVSGLCARYSKCLSRMMSKKWEKPVGNCYEEPPKKDATYRAIQHDI